MEYILNKKTLAQPEYVLDTAVEQPVDTDVVLPDYCPDIERILCCSLIPKVYLANVSADRVNIEGSSCVRVMYVDGDRGCVRSYEYSVPFSTGIPLRENVSDCALYVEAKPEYLNCRAMSPRKLSLHGAFSLCVKVAVSSGLDYYTYDTDDDLQVLKKQIEVSELSGMCSESFTVQEDISVDINPEAGSVLSHRLQARITELKAIHNKIMLSADLKLELMYLSDIDKKEIGCMSYNIPVSRVIDCEGVDETSTIDGSLDVMSSEIRLSGDALGGSAVLGVDAKLCFSAMCYDRREIELLSDAFSTERGIDVSAALFSCRGDTVCRAFTDISKAKIDTGESIGRVIDVHGEKIVVNASFTDGSLRLDTKLCVGILFENGDGDIRYAERDAVVACQPDTEGCDCVDNVRAALESLSYRMLGSDSIELRAELGFRLTVSRRESCAAVTGVSAADDAPLCESDGSLVLYFTDGNEQIWDISKRFRSRPDDIVSENGLEGETVPDGIMLLIPTP